MVNHILNKDYIQHIYGNTLGVNRAVSLGLAIYQKNSAIKWRLLGS